MAAGITVGTGGILRIFRFSFAQQPTSAHATAQGLWLISLIDTGIRSGSHSITADRGAHQLQHVRIL